MKNTHESRTSDERQQLWGSFQKRIDEILHGREALEAVVRVPMYNDRYVIGSNRLETLDKGGCIIKLKESDNGYEFSIGDTTLHGKPRQVGLPTFQGRKNQPGPERFDKFVISGSLNGFEMLGFNGGVEIQILPADNFEPAEDLFATCIYALEAHARNPMAGREEEELAHRAISSG